MPEFPGSEKDTDRQAVVPDADQRSIHHIAEAIHDSASG
jgi:hypothetical protein